MLTEVVTGHCVEAEEARALRRDATAMIERMAVQARTAGLDQPVAAAVALGARVSQLAGPEDFAERIGVDLSRLVEAEAGAVRFGDLPPGIGRLLLELEVDLLSLADLEVEWRTAADGDAGDGQEQLFDLS
jgi:hypothetical protein